MVQPLLKEEVMHLCLNTPRCNLNGGERGAHSDAHFALGDLRKFCEQHGDAIGRDRSNRAYIMTHGVSSVEWKHYRHPLPDSAYDVYMRYWKDVRFQLHS